MNRFKTVHELTCNLPSFIMVNIRFLKGLSRKSSWETGCFFVACKIMKNSEKERVVWQMANESKSLVSEEQVTKPAVRVGPPRGILTVDASAAQVQKQGELWRHVSLL